MQTESKKKEQYGKEKVKTIRQRKRKQNENRMQNLEGDLLTNARRTG